LGEARLILKRNSGLKAKIFYRWILKRAARQGILGRYRDPGQPRLGRFDHQEVTRFTNRSLELFEELLPGANLSQFRSRGNRLNVALAVFTLAAYRALREQGLTRDWATMVFADIGWSIYTIAVNIPLAFIRPFTSDPQKRLNFILRVFLFFPFAEDPLGYKRTYWKENDHYRTDWFRCAPFDYFRKHASEEEIDLFRRSWCLYDFALPGLVSPGAHYERPHTLSSGDEVCDMYWYGHKPRGLKNGKQNED